MKLIDCCMYFDEDLMLDLRLNILNDNVDKFIIAEATRDHSGNEKKLNFNLQNFSKKIYIQRINFFFSFSLYHCCCCLKARHLWTT